MGRRRAWIAVAALMCAAIALSVILLDRPAARFAHDALGGHLAFVALTHIVDPVLPVAAVGFVLLGSAILLGWRPARGGHAAFTVCTATLLAVVTKDQLKYVFGRTWPETWMADKPSWIRDGVMAFAPFHGGIGWSSFPSGHMTLATAPAGALVLVLRSRWRWLVLAPVVLVGVGLFGADYHYPADILAGVMVGFGVAAISVQAFGPASPGAGAVAAGTAAGAMARLGALNPGGS